MKKYISVFLCMILSLPLFFGCAAGRNPSKDISIVVTIFPEYDWVRSILGERLDQVELTLLLNNGVDLHSYQPTAKDMIKIDDCDLFIYVGGESDGWVDDVLDNTKDRERKVMKLLSILGEDAKTEEVVEGMEHDDHDHDHEEEHDDHDDDHDHEQADEHVWLSLKNASRFCLAISEMLQTIDPENRELYARNTESYLASLAALDREYQNVVDHASQKTILFGDRFPFRYLTDDYGLSYYAAFSGCSAESEAKFETICFLSEKVDALGLPCVLAIDGKRHKIAETVVQNTKEKNQKVLLMDSMQSVASADVENGVTYLSVMKQNLAVLQEALG